MWVLWYFPAYGVSDYCFGTCCTRVPSSHLFWSHVAWIWFSVEGKKWGAVLCGLFRFGAEGWDGYWTHRPIKSQVKFTPLVIRLSPLWGKYPIIWMPMTSDLLKHRHLQLRGIEKETNGLIPQCENGDSIAVFLHIEGCSDVLMTGCTFKRSKKVLHILASFAFPLLRGQC